MTADTPRLLVLVRHAKSAWPDVPDHERPLAERGRRDAPLAGRWLRDHGHVPDRVICSTARRTRETWQLASGYLDASPPVTYDRRLYGADLWRLLDVVAECSGDIGTLLLVGHDPGMQELTLHLAGDAAGDALERVRSKFPTGAIATLAITSSWAELGAGSADLTGFVVPPRHDRPHHY
jgi:phosphohistidine phosphatase